MVTLSIADAKARLSEVVERVEAGESVRITRRGKPVALVTGLSEPRKPIDVNALRALTSVAPPQGDLAKSMVRSMRDDDRY